MNAHKWKQNIRALYFFQDAAANKIIFDIQFVAAQNLKFFQFNQKINF